MAKYRNDLPLKNGDIFATDGGLETTLIFHEGVDLPEFAAFVLLRSDEGINTLTEITDDQQVAALMAQFEAAKPQSLSAGFRSLLHRFDRDHDAPVGGTVESAAVAEEGSDSNEQHVDRTRDSLGDLLARIKSYGPEGRA